jgi:hypothetical protein
MQRGRHEQEAVLVVRAERLLAHTRFSHSVRFPGGDYRRRLLEEESGTRAARRSLASVSVRQRPRERISRSDTGAGFPSAGSVDAARLLCSTILKMATWRPAMPRAAAPQGPTPAPPGPREKGGPDAVTIARPMGIHGRRGGLPLSACPVPGHTDAAPLLAGGPPSRWRGPPRPLDGAAGGPYCGRARSRAWPLVAECWPDVARLKRTWHMCATREIAGHGNDREESRASGRAVRAGAGHPGAPAAIAVECQRRSKPEQESPVET